MKTINACQTSSASPRLKRRGLICLGLLCLLSALTASIQGFAQGSINVDIARRLTPQQSETAVTSMVPAVAPIQTKATTIATRWDNVTATPSWISASMGGPLYLSGRLMGRNPNGSYSPLPNQTVYLVLDGGRTFKKVTDRNGWVQFKGYFPPRPGLIRPGSTVTMGYTWFYRPSRVFAPSQKTWFVTFGS
jgi:hypothetical protein